MPKKDKDIEEQKEKIEEIEKQESELEESVEETNERTDFSEFMTETPIEISTEEPITPILEIDENVVQDEGVNLDGIIETTPSFQNQETQQDNLYHTEDYQIADYESTAYEELDRAYEQRQGVEPVKIGLTTPGERPTLTQREAEPLDWRQQEHITRQGIEPQQINIKPLQRDTRLPFERGPERKYLRKRQIR